MTEAQLYNLVGSASAGAAEARDAKNLILVMMIQHLRFEHGMALKDIAARCGMKMKAVKAILAE